MSAYRNMEPVDTGPLQWVADALRDAIAGVIVQSAVEPASPLLHPVTIDVGILRPFIVCGTCGHEPLELTTVRDPSRRRTWVAIWCGSHGRSVAVDDRELFGTREPSEVVAAIQRRLNKCEVKP